MDCKFGFLEMAVSLPAGSFKYLSFQYHTVQFPAGQVSGTAAGLWRGRLGTVNPTEPAKQFRIEALLTLSQRFYGDKKGAGG